MSTEKIIRQNDDGGWARTGKLATGDTLKQVTMQAVFDVAANYTVEFGSPSIAGAEVQADITWSVGGNSVTRTVDVGDGVSVTGTAKAVKIVMRDNTSAGGLHQLAANLQYDIGVQVSPGTRGSSNQPPILNGGRTVVSGGGASGVIPVPTNSGVKSMFISPVPAISTPLLSGDASIEIGVSDGLGDFLIIATFDALLMADKWVPFIPGCNGYQIQNNSGANISFSVVFGIDG